MQNTMACKSMNVTFEIENGDAPATLAPARVATRNRHRRGVVILVVTVVILLVSLAAYGFLTLMQTENKAALARGDQLQAQAVAASGREFLASILELPRSARPAGATRDDMAELFGNILVDGDPDDSDDAARQGRFSILAPNQVETADRNWRFGYENESAKINLGRLLSLERRDPEAGRNALMNLPNMDESTADAILDWIDPDDEERDQGAESEYYSGLSPPRRPRNALPPTLDELLLVKGVTREKLFGIDLNANFQIDASEEELARQQAESSGDATPWCRYLTVQSAERDETYEGQPRVQLNQTDLGALHRELAAALEASWANYIVAYRQYGPYRGSGEGNDASELPVDLQLAGTRRIRSTLELIGTRVGIPTAQEGSKRKGGKQKVKVFNSPFSTDPGLMREYLPRLMDAVTTGSGAPLAGRVNINLAPPEVLAALPGIDMALADRIVSARAMQSGDDLGGQHAVWLLVEGIVDRQAMMRLERYVTTGGDVGRAQIIGYYDQRSPIMRFETVVDATGLPARQLYYKDLRRLGRGVVDDVMNITGAP